jgi:hypothetical protein
MSDRNISSEEQHCMSDCIRKFWGDTDHSEDPETRDRDYEQCLTDCQVCG